MEPSLRNYGSYILKRHLRIYPAYLLVLACAILARATVPEFDSTCLSEWINKFWNGALSLKQCLMSLFLVSPFDADALNPVVWTLRIEMRMCFFLPFVQWLMKRWNSLVVCGLCIVLGALVPFFAYLPVFAMGMAACQNKERILKWMRSKRLLLTILAFVLIDYSYICKWLGWETASFIQNNVTALGASIMLLCVYEISANRNGLGRVFETLGNQSYHIYLVHMPVLIWFRFICGRFGFWVYAIIATSVAYILATVLNRADDRIHRAIYKKFAT